MRICRIYSLAITFVLTANTLCFTQTPNIDITVSATVCQGEVVDIVNNTTADTFQWDFCIGDLETAPVPGLETGVSSGVYFHLDMIRANGTWFAFALNRNTNNIVRHQYANGLMSAPISAIVDGSEGEIFDRSAISMVEVNGQFYGFVGFDNGKIYRLDFGTDITNSMPNATDLGNFGAISGLDGLQLVMESVDSYKIVVSYSTSIGIIDLGNDIESESGVFSRFAVAGSSRLWSVDVIQEAGEFYGIISSLNRKIFRIDFGTEITNTIDLGTSIVELPNNFGAGAGDVPRHVRWVKDGCDFYALVNLTSGEYVRYSFDMGIMDNNPLVENVGNVNGFEGAVNAMDVAFENSTWYALDIDGLLNPDGSVNRDGSEIHQAVFKKLCDETVSGADSQVPSVKYASSGVKPFFLEATNSFGTSVLCGEITVTTDVAPPISYTSQNICLTSPIQFTSQSSSTGLSYSWDFGDTNTSTAPNPSHTYGSVGDYTVILDVSDGTCTNSVEQNITIFDEPIPTFTLPAGVICTNQAVFIENTTTGDFGGNETWQWQEDGLTVSTDRDFVGSFNDGGITGFKLIASIPGCTNELAQNIDVQQGPIPSFTVDDACQGALMNFSNESSGNIISYLWDFDNGFTSNLENPALEYSSAGSFDVSLTVESDVGCVTTTENLVTVYSNPLVQFSNELSCSQDITQFNDLSTVDDANIVSWRWDFDDPGSGSNSSTDQNATHIFSGPGNFDVELVATSVFGCEDSLTQVIPVLPAPGADFTFDRACIGEPVNFQDTSIPVSGESITSWAWDIAGQFSAEQNPSSTFNVALDYNVTLFVTSENLCVGSTSRVVSIAEAAEVEFGTDFQCENQPVKFFDLTATNGDAVNSWSWDFEGRGQANDSTVFFDFGEVGQFVVDLDILTANGCSYSSQRAVVVNAAPTAAFTPSATFGAPPLEVQFTNESVDASTFLWTFEEGVTATTIDPSHIYNDLGEFETQLIATNDALCRDTVSQQILVLLPDLEVELNGLFVVEDGQQSLVLSLTNNGTLRVEEMVARVDLGGNLVVTEIIDQRLDPQQTINYTLNLSITENQLSYICVEIIPAIEGLEDSNPANNSRCEDFSDDGLVVSHPYPNPVTGVIHMNVVTETGQPLTVRLINSTGGLAKSYDLLLRDGFNEISLNVDDLTQGIYFLQIPSLDRVDQVFISR